MSIKLTIGSAVYNVEEDLLKAHIENVLKQLNDETELLLIDDCSTNRCGEICREYAKNNSRIRYVNMGKNQGLSCVRNRTIDEAQGEWIFFADADDLLSDHFVEIAFSFLAGDYDIIIHDRLKFLDHKGTEQACTVKALTPLPKDANAELCLSILCLKPFDFQKYGMSDRAFYHAAWGAFYRKEFLTKNDLRFTPGIKKAQDSVFNGYAYFCAQKIAYLPYVMYYYRNNPQGITKRYSAEYANFTMTLIENQTKCLHTIFPDDKEADEYYKANRAIALIIDGLRLNFCHPDNPKPRKERKKEFYAFLEKEPLHCAVKDVDLNRKEHLILPVWLIRRRLFFALDLLQKHMILNTWFAAVIRRIKKLKSK